MSRVFFLEMNMSGVLGNIQRVEFQQRWPMQIEGKIIFFISSRR